MTPNPTNALKITICNTKRTKIYINIFPRIQVFRKHRESIIFKKISSKLSAFHVDVNGIVCILYSYVRVCPCSQERSLATYRAIVCEATWSATLLLS